MGNKDMERNGSSSGCTTRFFLHFLALGTGRSQGTARKGVPLLYVSVWELVPRAEYPAASERGELREGEKDKQRPGGETVPEPDGLFHPERDCVPANLYARRCARSTHTLTVAVCRTHSIAFTRMPALQMCNNTLVSHRGVSAATHTQENS